MYYQPMVIYREPGTDRTDAILRYIGNRVLRNNKNFLCALVGQTGSGKSWLGVSLCEKYGKMFNIKFDPRIHIVSSVREVIRLIKDKKVRETIQIGTPILFDEPQAEANARNWQAESNKMLSLLVSTFRNQRLVVFFATPYLEMIDKQTRVLFHAEFKVLGFDKNTGLTTLKPRFLEYMRKIDDFYRKMLIIKYRVPAKRSFMMEKLGKWSVYKPSDEAIKVYEEYKAQFSEKLINTMEAQLAKADEDDAEDKKSRVFMKVHESFLKYGEDYPKILSENPSITPYTLEKYIKFIKRGLKVGKVRTSLTQSSSMQE